MDVKDDSTDGHEVSGENDNKSDKEIGPRWLWVFLGRFSSDKKKYNCNINE